MVFVFGLDFTSAFGCGFAAGAPNRPPPSSSSSSLNSPPPDFGLLGCEAGGGFTSVFLGSGVVLDSLNRPASSCCGPGRERETTVILSCE